MAWFTEAQLPGGRGGIRIGIEVSEQLVDEPTEFGHIEIYDSPFFGRFLALDGIVQVSESDEFIYHEMMVTLPGLLHGSPERFLILGGGDGGALKHALRFPSCVAATQVEINDRVRELCALHLPGVSDGAFDDPRANLVCGDAFEAVRDGATAYDVITLDLTDPTPTDRPRGSIRPNIWPPCGTGSPTGASRRSTAGPCCSSRTRWRP
jgi:spermidine synthase